MLAITPLLEVSISTSIQQKPKTSPSPTTNIGTGNKPQLTANDAAKIIERNNQGPQAKAVVNINPSSAADFSKQSASSASNAANRYSNQSNTAGQRASSLTSSYVTKPTRTPGRVNTNPTFSARGI